MNSDVAAVVVDPLTHYRSTGCAEGGDPNPNVDLAAVDGLEYIASYVDLINAFGANKAGAIALCHRRAIRRPDHHLRRSGIHRLIRRPDHAFHHRWRHRMTR